MALHSHWKAQIKIDFLQDVEPQLKSSGHIKDRKIFTLYLETLKTP